MRDRDGGWPLILLFLAGCSDLRAYIVGTDGSDYVPLQIEPVLICEEGLDIHAYVTGSTISSVSYVVRDAGGTTLFHGDLTQDLDYSEHEEHWSVTGLAANCAAAMSIDITAANPCETEGVTEAYTPAAVVLMSPVTGPASGGTTVLIAVTPGTADWSAPSVQFGLVVSASTTYVTGAECADVGGTTCVRTVTPAQAEGDVAVTVYSTDGHAFPVADRFHYGPNSTGAQEGLVKAQEIFFDPAWFYYGSPYVDIGTASSFAQVELLFHQPILASAHTHYYDAWSSAADCDGGTASYTSVGAGDRVLFDGTAMPSYLANTNGNAYWAVDTSAVAAYPGTTLDVQVLDGSSDIPAQTITDAVRFPSLLSSSSFDDPSRPGFVSGTATLRRGQDLVLTWASPDDLDGLTWSAAGVSGFTVLASGSCTTDPDPGTLTIPWSMLSGGDDDAMTGVTLTLQFWKDTHSTLGHDGSDLWGRGILFLETYVTVVD